MQGIEAFAQVSPLGRLPLGKQSRPSLLEKISYIKKLQHACAGAFAQVKTLGPFPSREMNPQNLMVRAIHGTKGFARRLCLLNE